jgi:hypothetical protein
MDGLKNIFIVYDDDKIGYIVKKYENNDTVYTTFWINYEETKNISYSSKKDLYDYAIKYMKSDLTEYSPIHIVQTKMFKEYIDWYEDQNYLQFLNSNT